MQGHAACHFKEISMRKVPVGILGATGIVGQNYLRLLKDHPLFEVVFLASSKNVEEIETCLESCRFVFSAMSTEGAKQYEERYAQRGIPVISNASFHRASPDVPVLIPEVNPEHAAIIPIQQRNRGWKRGFIVTKPNCSLQSYMIPLAPLHARFKVKRLIVTTMQAVSGAGYPGVASLDILDNVIPYIEQEEEKSEQEPLKIWGRIRDNRIQAEEGIVISAHCNRVPVVDGHMACVSVQFETKPTRDEILQLWQGLVVYRDEAARPQPKLDRMAGNGMDVTVGRLRPCPVLDFRFVALSHNTIRGAAGGGILNAEFLLNAGYLS